ncbi:MAG: ABC transporter permease [Acidimicrobiia bacterium]
MRAFLAIIRVTIRQTLRLRRAIGLVILSGAATAMYLLIILASRNSTGSLAGQRQDAIDAAVGLSASVFMNILVPVVTLIIATSVLGDERRDNTMSFLVLRPIRRFNIGAAKVVAAVLEAFTVTGIGAASLGVLVAIKIHSFAWLVPLVVGAAIATAAYAAIFVPLGYLLKRATLIGLTYVFIWENGIVAAIPGLATLSPWRIGLSATAALAPAEFTEHIPTDFALGSLNPGAGGALAKAVIMGIAAAALVASILRRRDLAGGSS